MKTKDTAPQLKLITWQPTEAMYDKDGNQFKGDNDHFIAEDDLYAIAKKMTELPMHTISRGPWGSTHNEAFYDPNVQDDEVQQYVRISDVIAVLYGLTHDVEPGKTVVLDAGCGIIRPAEEKTNNDYII